MNSQVINDLSIYVPPNNPREKSSNSLTVNRFGDICILAAENTTTATATATAGDCDNKTPLIVFGNARSTSSAGNKRVCSPLPLNEASDMQKLRTYGFQNISFNSSGSALLLWSSTHVGVVLIPKSLTVDGMLLPRDQETCKESADIFDSCTFHLIAGGDSSTNVDIPRIAKASFHGYSSNHVVILRETSSLLVVDIISGNEQFFAIDFLGEGVRCESFTFGPDIDWIRFTIFILTNNSSIYALCPVVPLFSNVTAACSDELWAWYNEETQGIGIQSTNRKAASYYGEVYRYMSGVFGTPTLGSPTDYTSHQSFLSSPSPSSPMFEHRGDTLTNSKIGEPMQSYNHIFTKDDNNNTDYLTSPVALQGPLKIERNGEIIKANKLSKGKSTKVCATDLTFISTPGTPTSTPILAISYSNGDVDLGMITINSENSNSYISPSWKKISPALPYAPPLVLIVERIHTSTSFQSIGGSWDGKWQIMSDLVYAHNFHLWCSSSPSSSGLGHCGAYLISSPWIKKLVQNSSEASSSTENEDEDYPSGHVSIDKSNVMQIYSESSAVAQQEAGELGCEETKDQAHAQAHEGAHSLSGYSVICDPIVGHLSIFRNSKGVLGAVNVSVHSRLHDHTHALISNRQYSDGDNNNSSTSALSMDIKIDETKSKLQHNLMAKLILDMKGALMRVPKPLNDKVYETERDALQDISSASQFITDSILLPMEQFSNRANYRLESVDVMNDMQTQFITGLGIDIIDVEAKPVGITQQLDRLGENHELLHVRLMKIQERYKAQKEVIARLYLKAIKCKTAMAGEVEERFKRELLDWKREVSTIDEHIESLRRRRVETRALPSFGTDAMLASSMHSMHLHSHMQSPPQLGGVRTPLAGAGIGIGTRGSGSSSYVSPSIRNLTSMKKSKQFTPTPNSGKRVGKK